MKATLRRGCKAKLPPRSPAFVVQNKAGAGGRWHGVNLNSIVTVNTRTICRTGATEGQVQYKTEDIVCLLLSPHVRRAGCPLILP